MAVRPPPEQTPPKGAVAAVEQKALVTMGQHGLEIRDFEGLWRFSVVVAHSQLAPAGMRTPEQIFVAVQTGMEAGLTPMASIQSLVVINGNVRWKGDAALGLVRQSGLLEGFEREYRGKAYEDDFTCLVKLRRKGIKGEIVGEFSVDDAKRAGLWDRRTSSGQATPWVTHPKRMLYFRALGFALSDGFSDVLRSMRLREEIDEEERTPTQATVTIEKDDLLEGVMDEPPTPAVIDVDGEKVDSRTGEVADGPPVSSGEEPPADTSTEAPPPSDPDFPPLDAEPSKQEIAEERGEAKADHEPPPDLQSLLDLE